MSALYTLSSRQHLLITGLAALAAIAVVILLFAVSPTAVASVLSTLILLAAVALRVVMTASAAPRAPRAQMRAGATEVTPPLLLTLADGETLVAREVDSGQPGDHRLLLTRKGYVLVNAEGEVIYRL
ncbi:MAG: hypothetical protein ACUVS4_10270 [Chloroflexaceae bacterium]